MDDRLEQLEQEIFQLRKQREVFDGVSIPPRPKANPAIKPREQQARQSTPANSTSASASATQNRSASQPPVHPFAAAKDVNRLPKPSAIAPPTTTRPSATTQDKAYRTTAPAYNPNLATEVFNRSLKTPSITITPEELLSISPDVRAKYRELVTPKRVAQSDLLEVNTVQSVMAGIDEEGGEEVEGIANFLQTPSDNTIVAKESHALRSISAIIGGCEIVECILDPGCQIIAMSEPICHALGLAYDPTVRIPMQSANKQIDHTLGIVRNVSVQAGDIVVYVQAHVVRNAAYDFLLGRPFDVLTHSVVTNFGNEEQTITIECPNSGNIATIPTYPRGNAKHRKDIVKALKESQDPNFR